MKRIKLDTAKLSLLKEKVTSLTSSQMQSISGGYEMTLVNFTCETDTSPNTNVECELTAEDCGGGSVGPVRPSLVVNSIQNCLCF